MLGIGSEGVQTARTLTGPGVDSELGAQTVNWSQGLGQAELRVETKLLLSQDSRSSREAHRVEL